MSGGDPHNRFRERCAACGYEARGCRSYTCPECGEDLRATFVVWARRRRGRRFARWLIAAQAISFAAILGQLALMWSSTRVEYYFPRSATGGAAVASWRVVLGWIVGATAGLTATTLVGETARLWKHPTRYGELSRTRARRVRRWALAGVGLVAVSPTMLGVILQASG